MASFWDFLPTIVTAGATIYGAKQASDVKEKAASQALSAQQGATAAEQEAIKVAQRNMERQQQMASPGLMALQSIIGRGEQLTPAQMIALEDARRTSLDSLQGGSLRGSARATAAVVNDVEGRMRAGFMDSNRSRADQAASNLSGQYFNAGNNISDLNLKSGLSASQGLMNTGEINAANTIGQGAVKGQAIGDLGAIIADQVKRSSVESRDSSYKPTAYNDIVWNDVRKGGVM